MDIPLTGSNLMTGTGIAGAGSALDWSTAEGFWRDSFDHLPYATADRDFEYYRPAFRYGTEAAAGRQGRSWKELEPDLQRGWDTYEHRAGCPALWDEISPAVLDAWTRYCGGERPDTNRQQQRAEDERPADR
jgi:hypothetical protein